MGNKKKLINKGLISLFPKDINTFVDIFAGSGVVSMNTVAKKYMINDIDNNFYLFQINKLNHNIIFLYKYSIARFPCNIYSK